MLVDTLAAAGPDGESGSFGLLLVMLAIAVIGLLPVIAVVVGGALLVAGFIQRSAHDRRLAASAAFASVMPPYYPVGAAQFAGVSPPRRGDGTVLLVIGGFMAALGLLGLAALALI